MVTRQESLTVHLRSHSSSDHINSCTEALRGSLVLLGSISSSPTWHQKLFINQHPLASPALSAYLGRAHLGRTPFPGHFQVPREMFLPPNPHSVSKVNAPLNPLGEAGGSVHQGAQTQVQQGLLHLYTSNSLPGTRRSSRTENDFACCCIHLHVNPRKEDSY